MADLEVFQHPLSKWGHSKTPFAVTTSQIDFHMPAQPAEPPLAALRAVGFVQWQISSTCLVQSISHIRAWEFGGAKGIYQQQSDFLNNSPFHRSNFSARALKVSHRLICLAPVTLGGALAARKICEIYARAR
jgi:hypothetical protein